MKILIEKQLFLVLFISLSLLGMMTYFAFQQFKKVIDTSQWVEKSNIVLGRYEEILHHTEEMESGSRGYVITGNVKFLEPYHKAIDSIKSDFRNFENQVDNYGFQKKDIDNLKMLID